MGKPTYRVLITGWCGNPAPQYIVQDRSKRPSTFRSEKTAQDFVRKASLARPHCKYEIVRV